MVKGAALAFVYSADIGAMTEKIRQSIEDHARLGVDVSTLSDDDDLYGAGMTSHASVNVMLALEDAFDIEFPDRMLRRAVFESINSIRAALTELSAEMAA
jgi:acyl carrier protein